MAPIALARGRHGPVTCGFGRARSNALGGSPSLQKQTEALSADVRSASRHDYVDIRALAWRTCVGKLRTNFFRALRHASQSPVTVSLARLLGNHVEAPSVVPAGEDELASLVVEFDRDTWSFGMAKGIGQGFPRDAKDLLHNIRLE